MMVTPEDRATLKAIADYLIPAHRNMPSASEVDVQGVMLDEVLKHRRDVLPDLKRALAALAGQPLSEAINALLRQDPAAFNALTLTISGGYYMAPAVRDALGYPGQEQVAYDPYAVADYLLDGLLERVVKRGPVYRPTPR